MEKLREQMDEGLQAEEGDLRKRDRFIKQYK